MDPETLKRERRTAAQQAAQQGSMGLGSTEPPASPALPAASKPTIDAEVPDLDRTLQPRGPIMAICVTLMLSSLLALP